MNVSQPKEQVVAEEELLMEATAWSMRRPCLLASPSSLRLTPLPTELKEDDIKRWNTICGHDGVIRFVAQIFGADGSVSDDSMVASNRYSTVSKLVESVPFFVPFLLLLAECHFLLHDTHGALELAKRARIAMQRSGEQDDVLSDAIRMLQILANEEKKEFEPDDPTILVSTYSRPPAWACISAPSNLEELQSRWKKLQESGDGAEQFARFASVESNQLEGVFLLEGDSSKKLARLGLCRNSIEGISRDSRKKEPDRVLSILKNTQHCYKMIKDLIGNDKKFTICFLRYLHRRLLEDNNIEYHAEKWDNDCQQNFAVMTPLGTFRKVPCFASHGDCETRFCPAEQIEAEMEWLVSNLLAVLSDCNLYPYRACAWIQHTLFRIHPFSDGNGRIGRLISSIPLLLADLPPTMVSMQSKQKYFALLKKADDTGDIDDLASFLQQEAFNAMESLLTYVPSPSRPVVVCRGRRAFLRQRISPSNSPSNGNKIEKFTFAGEEKKEEN